MEVCSMSLYKTGFLRGTDFLLMRQRHVSSFLTSRECVMEKTFSSRPQSFVIVWESTTVCSLSHQPAKVDRTLICHMLVIHAQRKSSTSLKSGSLFMVMVSVRMYVTYVHTKQNKQTNRGRDQRVKPLYKLVTEFLFKV